MGGVYRKILHHRGHAEHENEYSIVFLRTLRAFCGATKSQKPKKPRGQKAAGLNNFKTLLFLDTKALIH